MFLAMDTVFDQCSIAILDSSGQVLSSHTETGKRQQTQQILPMIDAALSEAQLRLADIQALIFNRGPGAFSGIRINTAVVQALSVAHDLPCVSVSSLQAIAQCAYQKYGLTHLYSALMLVCSKSTLDSMSW
nr:tRNA (adenosine(37)-N6)-threonylcarbamoyltransferase complex dimerization subunit type 1 TsaB [Psychrobacter sp. JCM 18901]